MTSTTPAPAPAETSRLAHLNALAPGAVIVLGMLAAMWAVELVDLIPGIHLDRWGIRPRSWRGLLGIVLAPFLHVGFGHLLANTIPFAILGGIIALSGRSVFVEVTLTVGLVSGLGVWLFGRSGTVHIGASGLIFGYITYLVLRGVFARRVVWVLGGLIVAVMYGGSLIFGVLPTTRYSWLGHLFGALGGVLAAYAMHATADEQSGTVATAGPTGSVPRA